MVYKNEVNIHISIIEYNLLILFFELKKIFTLFQF